MTEDWRLARQREAAYTQMTAVAAALLRDGYAVEADRVIDWMVERMETKLWPAEYMAWMRDEANPRPSAFALTQEELDRVESLVLHRRSSVPSNDLTWRPETKTS